MVACFAAMGTVDRARANIHAVGIEPPGCGALTGEFACMTKFDTAEQCMFRA